MDAGKFPIFGSSYAAYLHEDRRLENRDPDGAIPAFRTKERLRR
jgi:hypothetical protein